MLTTEEVQALLDVSPATMRRDLAALEQQGRIVRVHGGVMARDALRGEARFDLRRTVHADAKRAMGREVASRIPKQGRIFIDAGTSTIEVGRCLLQESELTLVTNSVPLLMFGDGAQARLICLGGELMGVSMGLMGEVGLDWLEKLHFDIAVMGASGLSPEEGASATNLIEAGMKRRVMQRARQSWLVAEAGKYDQPHAVQFAAWPDFSCWFTHGELPRGTAARMRKHGVNLHRCDQVD